MMPKENGVLS